MKKYIKRLLALIITFSTFFIMKNVYAGSDATICIYDYEGKDYNIHIVVDSNGDAHLAKVANSASGDLYNWDSAKIGNFVGRDYYKSNNFKCPPIAVYNWGQGDVYVTDESNYQAIADDIWNEVKCKLIGQGLISSAPSEVKKSKSYTFTVPKKCVCEGLGVAAADVRGQFTARFTVDSYLNRPTINVTYAHSAYTRDVHNWFPTASDNIGSYSYIKDLIQNDKCPEFMVFGINRWAGLSDRTNVESITSNAKVGSGFSVSCHEEGNNPTSNIPTPTSNKKSNVSNEVKSNNADFMVISQYKSCGGKDGVIIGKIPSIIPRITASLYNAIMVIVPVILIIMGSIDLVKGIASQKEDEMKKGRETFIKRLIGAVIVFLIVLLVKLLIGMVAGTSENRNRIIHCIDCFISNTCDTIEEES